MNGESLFILYYMPQAFVSSGYTMGISKRPCFEDHFFDLEWAVSEYDGTSNGIYSTTVDGSEIRLTTWDV